MVTRCNKCGCVTQYILDDVIDEKTNIIQLNLFGDGDPIIVGIINCKRCGCKIEVKTREEIINEINKKE